MRISWTIKGLISLMHGVTMKTMKILTNILTKYLLLPSLQDRSFYSRNYGGDRTLSYLQAQNVISLLKYGGEYSCTPY